MMNNMIYSVASMAFLLVGYSVAFGDFGSDSMSQWAAFLFQMAFVGKVVNIMSGGISERAKVIPMVFFTILMSVVITEDRVQEVVDTIAKSAQTGKIGDGKIFVSSIEKTIRIRTSEENEEAI